MKINVTFDKLSYDVGGTSDGTKNGVYVALADILKKFSKKLDATKPFPNAVLTNVDGGSIVMMDNERTFLCHVNVRYKLTVGRATRNGLNIEPLSFSRARPNSDRPKFASLVDIEIAAMLSMLAYEEKPIEIINRDFAHSNGDGWSTAVEELGASSCGLKHASRAQEPYLLAVSKRLIADDSSKEHTRSESTLWVAFRGSQEWIKDYILTNARFLPLDTPTGKIHTGFFTRAQQYPKDLFTGEFQTGKYQRLIFTGHSLGGAVAHVRAIEQLRNCAPLSSTHIYSIAFGAPFIGDSDNASWVSKHYGEHFLTIVNKLDFVAGLLPLSVALRKLGKTLWHYMSLAERVPEDDNSFERASDFRDSVHVTQDFQKPIRPVNRSQVASKGQYIPFGVYAFIRVDKTEEVIYVRNQAEQDFISERIRELMLDQRHGHEWNRSAHEIKSYIRALIDCKVIVRKPLLSETILQIREVADACTPCITETSIVINDTGDYLDIKLKGIALSCVHAMFQICDCTTLQIAANSAISEIRGEKRYEAVTFRITTLLPSHARITVGSHTVSFMTDFKEVSYALRHGDLVERNRVNHSGFTKASPLDANLLYTAVLRAYFAELHQSHDKDTRSIGDSNLKLVQHLMEHLRSKSASAFEGAIKKHTNNNQQTGDVRICDDFHKDILPLIRGLYIVLQGKVEYEIPRGYCWAALMFVGGLTTVAISMTPAGIMVGAAFVTTGMATGLGTYVRYNDANTCAYRDNLYLIAASLDVNVIHCKNEYSLEFEMKNKLIDSGIPFELHKFNEISYNQLMKLFVTPATKTQPTLKGANEASKRKAFMRACCAITIHSLRCSVTDQIYIAIIDLQRTNKFLTTLWNIPVNSEPSVKIQQHTLRDSTSKNDQHLSILILPSLKNLRETVMKLNHCYTINPVFCVVMAGYNDIDKITALTETNLTRSSHFALTSNRHPIGKATVTQFPFFSTFFHCRC